MARKKVRKVKITKGEVLVYTVGVFCLISTIILQVFCGASIGQLNMNIEEIKYDLSNQEKKNESLQMKVSELTSFDKIKDVVKDMGLAYNNDNIVIIDE